MPYATCPNCMSTFHLNVRVDAIDEWNNKFQKSEDGIRYIQCYLCWRELKESDLVEIWKVPEDFEGRIQKGDRGTVLRVIDKNSFEIDCLKEDGSSKSIEALPRNCLWFKIRSHS